jgi:Coenzyme PQQ synthesis protein D (PqqD)
MTGEHPLWQRDDGWAGSEIEDSFVMINIDSGQYIALNATASAIWDALAEPRDEADIVSALLQRFDVDADDCRSAVSTMLAQMHEMKMAAPV